MTEQALFESLDEHPTVAAYLRAARTLADDNALRTPLRVALLASYTIDMWLPYLEVESARLDFGLRTYVAPFNNVVQELLNSDSGCAAFGPEIVVIAEQLEDVCPQLATRFLSSSRQEIEQWIDVCIARIASSLRAFRSRCGAPVLVHNFALPVSPQLGLFEASCGDSQTRAIRRLNDRLADELARLGGVYLVDFDRCCAEVGYVHCRDEKLWFFARAPFALPLAVRLARTHAACFRALTASPKKCLVVDLDNTLWGGVLGEDGVHGIQLGSTFPGNIYKQVQQELADLRHRGVLLAINSKNNLADVEQVFEQHPDMVLQLSDFVAQRINWQPKPQNMEEIAEELNIGVDSLVYVDDNAVECELMRHALPEIETVAAADTRGRPDPLATLRWLRDGRTFDRLAWTPEDRQRTDTYRRQAERRQLLSSAANIEEFLNGLEMEAEIDFASGTTLPRVAELIQKTNQFNLTTRRYQFAELERLSECGECDILTMRLADRLGDNGLIATAILLYEGGTTVIDAFLLSCRVIGRQVETALLRYVLDLARRRGAGDVVGEFVPTKKNAPASSFFEQHGFRPYRGVDPVRDLRRRYGIAHHANGSIVRWRTEADASDVTWPDCIKLRRIAEHECAGAL